MHSQHKELQEIGREVKTEGGKTPYIKLVPTGQKEPKDLSFEPNPPITILSDIVEEAE